MMARFSLLLLLLPLFASAFIRTVPGQFLGGGSRIFLCSRLADEQTNFAEGGADDPLSPSSFRASVSLLDGYALREALLSRWGRPFNVVLRRQPRDRTVRCAVTADVTGSRRCRHGGEQKYLEHLQEITTFLRRYESYESFIDFVRTARYVPKVAGVSSVSLRLQLSEEQLDELFQS